MVKFAYVLSMQETATGVCAPSVLEFGLHTGVDWVPGWEIRISLQLMWA